MMNGDYGYWMWGGGVLMILFWLAVVALAIWGLRMLFSAGQSRQTPSAASALEVARLRYSRGEISREAYFALLNDLNQTRENAE